METLETERLILRPLCEDDYLDCFKWCGDARVNEFMIYPLYHKAEDVKEWLKTVNKEDNKMDFGYVLKETGELIGSGGIYFHEDEYVVIEGMVSKIKLEERVLMIVKKKINFDDIINIIGVKEDY